jgi:hypothetical protein
LPTSQTMKIPGTGTQWRSPGHIHSTVCQGNAQRDPTYSYILEKALLSYRDDLVHSPPLQNQQRGCSASCRLLASSSQASVNVESTSSVPCRSHLISLCKFFYLQNGDGWGWGCSSVAEHVLSMDSILTTAKQIKTKKRGW